MYYVDEIIIILRVKPNGRYFIIYNRYCEIENISLYDFYVYEEILNKSVSKTQF